MKDLRKQVRRKWNAVSSGLFQVKKGIYRLVSQRRNIDRKTVLFIIGCQRSGTSLMINIFKRDLNTAVYGEFSDLTVSGADRIRLRPLDEVK